MQSGGTAGEGGNVGAGEEPGGEEGAPGSRRAHSEEPGAARTCRGAEVMPGGNAGGNAAGRKGALSSGKVPKFRR